MPELERELLALADAVAFPPTPDLSARVRRALPVPRRQRRRRPALVLAVAAAALAVGAAFAVPGARTAILRLLGVGAVRIELVERLPEVRPSTPLEVGRPIRPEQAPFRLLASRLLGAPDSVHVQAGVVTLVYGSAERVRLLVTEIPGSGFTSAVGKKLAAHGTSVEFVPVQGANGPGVWIHGRAHVVQLPGGPQRLAGNTLIWQHGFVTLRLEGEIERRDAVRIADSFR